MIRYLTVCVILVLYLILTIPIFFVYWIIGKFNRRKRDILSLRTVQFGLKILLAPTGVNITVIGEENIPDVPALYVANHRSFFDILLTYSRCRDLTGYVAKKEMEKIPLLSSRMKYVHCLFLDRHSQKAGMQMILDAINHIKNGISVFIFPEGTRNETGEFLLMPFKEGSFRIATKSNCPIVPVALSNTSAIFEDQFPRIKKVSVVIEYCKPIYPSQLDRDEKKKLGTTCQSIILEKLKKNHIP